MRATLWALISTPAGVTWLVACTLKAGALLAVAGLGATLLRRRTAAARHSLWTFGVLAALLLPVLAWSLPAIAPATPTPRAAATSLQAPAIVVTPSSTPSTPASAPRWPLALTAVWAAGALVVGLRLVRSQRAAQRLVRTATPAVDAAWTAALDDATALVATSRRVELRRSEHIATPMTVGVVRPRVLLPASADAWSPARLRAVLVHELGHIRRRDTATQLVAQLACALYWWNPLAWFAAARLRVERELACDDLVLRAGILPSSYAADLLEVARAFADHAPPPAAALGMVDRSWTAARLRHIVDASAHRQPLRARFWLATTAVALASVATVACTSDRPALPQAQAAIVPPTDPRVAIAPATVAKPPAGPVLIGAPTTHRAPLMADPATFAAPMRPGTIDLAAVTGELQRHLGELEQCYARRLAAKPGLAGTILIHWNIEPSGKVPESCITEDTVGDPELAACVNTLVLARQFAPPTGGAVDVSFPFVFSPPT